MDSLIESLYSRQDVIRCTLCEFAVAPMYCEVCHIDLCKDCVEKHLADKSKLHKVVSLKQYLSTLRNPKCCDHPDTQCELYCEKCDHPICSNCVTSEKHNHHECVNLTENYQKKQEVLRKDLQELEQHIYPNFQKAAFFIPIQKDDQRKQSQKITAAVQKHGDALHTEINIIVKRMETEIDDMDTQHQAALDEQEDAINNTIRQITQTIQDLKYLLETSDVGLVSKYKSRIQEFRKLPQKLNVVLPKFNPVKINTEQLLKQFGSLSDLSVEIEEQDYILPSPGAESSPRARPLLDVPRLVTDIPTTGYRELYCVSCLSDEEIWTCGDNEIVKMQNLKGELLKSVETKSGNVPEDIAVTRSGDLVYTDYKDSSINLVSGTQIQTLITLRGWRPLYLCSTSTGDLLIIMTSNDGKHTKIVRYSGSIETQSIQLDDQGKPLYTSGYGDKYLSENRNLDICVADYDARAVVVVSVSGKLRFRYTGPPSVPRVPFHPVGITTDIQAYILTSDCNNNSIHIINGDGHFLRYINNCSLMSPWSLCVDSRENLFVAERDTGKVKKIQYYMYN
ncbi:uncharacterized protein LOC144621764 [Crassostrea virginica]